MRTTMAMLTTKINYLNHLMGYAETAYTKDPETGKYAPNPGVYVWSEAYGGIKLEQQSLTPGSTAHTYDPINMGYGTKKQAYELISAFIAGIKLGMEQCK